MVLWRPLITKLRGGEVREEYFVRGGNYGYTTKDKPGDFGVGGRYWLFKVNNIDTSSVLRFYKGSNRAIYENKNYGVSLRCVVR